jgi:hypothetical protein
MDEIDSTPFRSPPTIHRSARTQEHTWILGTGTVVPKALAILKEEPGPEECMRPLPKAVMNADGGEIARNRPHRLH